MGGVGCLRGAGAFVFFPLSEEVLSSWGIHGVLGGFWVGFMVKVFIRVKSKSRCCCGRADK